jgi:hypothetical protein
VERSLGHREVEDVVQDHADDVTLDAFVLHELVANIEVDAEVAGVAG